MYSLVRKPCLCWGFFLSGITLVSLFSRGRALRPSAESCYAQKLSIDQDTPDRVTSPKSEKKSARIRDAFSRLLTLSQFPPFRQQDNTILANPPVTAHRNMGVSAAQYAAF